MTPSHATEDPDMCKVTFQIEGDSWHRHSSESLWAKRLGSGKFRLENIPFFVPGFGYRDVVEAADGVAGLEFRRVAERSGYSTLRIVSESTDLATLAQQLRTMNCECETGEVGSVTILAVGVEPGADNSAIVAVLEEGREKKLWDWEAGFDATAEDEPHA